MTIFATITGRSGSVTVIRRAVAAVLTRVIIHSDVLLRRMERR